MPSNALDLIFGRPGLRYIEYTGGVVYGAEPWSTTPPPFGELSGDDFSLRVETAVMVPSTKDASKPVSDEEFRKRVRETEAFFSSMCGGFTSSDAEGGYWSDEKKSLIHERVKRVGTYCPIDSWKHNAGLVRRWLQKKAREWGQEAMGFEFEGDLYFVRRD